MAQMPPNAFRLGLLAGVVFLSSGVSALAQGAPISYGDESTISNKLTRSVAQAPSPRQVQTPAAQTSMGTDLRTRRIEFRYPDQPDTFYGQGGARSAQADESPIAFSSAETAISAQAARQYAATTAPDIPRDPAISSGGFDAQAAARAVEARQNARAGQSTRITATQPPAPAPTGQPLTLSKVRTSQGAVVSQESGLASIYDRALNGQKTANGEVHDRSALFAAHRTLPLPSLVQVVNEANGREIVVRVNDRGPFDPDRVIDLSERSAEMLGIPQGSDVEVILRYLGPAPVLPTPQSSTASSQIVSEDMTAPRRPTVQDPIYIEPSLGVPDPIKARVTVPAGQGSIYVQVGSFSDIGNAENLDNAIGRSLPVTIESANVRGSDYFRVLVGPFTSRGEAERQRAQLARAGIADGFVTQR